MASPRCVIRPVREVAFRTRPQILKRKVIPLVQTRLQSNDQKPKTTPVPPGTTGPNENQLPHVTEEQAAMDKSMGQAPPDIEQGTPVQEILERDKDAQKNAPQIIKENMKSLNGSGQTRSYSTSARRMAQAEVMATASQIGPNNMIRGMEYPEAGPGHKFPIPDIGGMSRLDHLKRRYDPVVDQLTKSIMKDGKLSKAQKHMTQILDILRTAPPPQPNPAFPGRTLLLSDNPSTTVPTPSPAALSSAFNPNTNSLQRADPQEQRITSLPRAALPLHPIEYLTTIIDSVAPLVKIRQQKGIAGGGASTPIPVPLGVRQRRRQAIQWILQAAENRRELKLAERIGKELLRVAEGQSGVWEKRDMVHRLGISARSNVRTGRRR